MVFKNKTKSLMSQSKLVEKVIGIKKNKPRKDGKYIESLDCVYYCTFFEFSHCEGAKYRETFHCMSC